MSNGLLTQDEKNLLNIKLRIGESELDENAKITAVAALDRYFEANGKECPTKDIDSFFTWAHQPEGGNFWCDVHDAIGYLEDGDE